MDQALYYDMMTRRGGVFDTIRTKMSWLRDEEIVVQHDRAPPHRGKGNKTKLDGVRKVNGRKISILREPPQSPDLNILDLGIFSSLKRRISKHTGISKTTEDLKKAANEVYNSYDTVTMGRAWARLFVQYTEILRNGVGNDYKSVKHPDIENP